MSLSPKQPDVVCHLPDCYIRAISVRTEGNQLIKYTVHLDCDRDLVGALVDEWRHVSSGIWPTVFAPFGENRTFYINFYAEKDLIAFFEWAKPKRVGDSNHGFTTDPGE